MVRKLAYDEAYIHWNEKVPGDLLRVRAELGKTYDSTYQRYIDGLANIKVLTNGDTAEKLLHAQDEAPSPGLITIMDSCVTNAYDAYRKLILGIIYRPRF